MHFLFKDYTDLVLKSFEEKRNTNQLSQLLMHPTTANLRQEFLNVYLERMKNGEKEEEYTLKPFFGVPPAGKNFAHNIDKKKADDFRPLQSLIKKEIKNPSPVNVELLAWLIDFKPRPFNEAKKFFEKETAPVNPRIYAAEIKDEPAKPGNSETASVQPEEKPYVIPGSILYFDGPVINNPPAAIAAVKEKEVRPYSKLKKTAAICLFVTVMLGGVYLIRREEQIGELPYGSMYTGCMYWADVEYEVAPCNEVITGKQLYPLNKELLKNFKRITREDTITERSIDVVHYISVNNIKEYYTMGGKHPVYNNRNLRPLSRYIYNKYLAKNHPPATDSPAE